MKKLLLFGIIMLTVAMSASAQLGLPTTTVKDTFDISRAYYNGAELNRADWPDTMIVEDALNVYIANYVYVKGKLKETHRSGRHYDATCNGKVARLVVKRSVGVFGELSYSIGEYRFVVRDRKMDDATNEEGDKNVGSVKANSTGFSLAGRSAISLPSPVCDTIKEGKIVVKIWVDRKGYVVNVSCPEKGSTLTDLSMCNASKEAALKARFTAKDSAPEMQTGTVTYVFRRD